MSQKKSSESRVIVKREFHGKELSFESGWIAKQAGAAVIARCGETMVLATVCSAKGKPGQNFLPLVVEYQEKFYASGRIPGGYLKREGRPGEHEILTCRIIDRPVRPMFADGFFDEVQVICTVMSADGSCNPDTLALSAATAALHLSSLPFMGPLAGLHVGRIDGKLVINPSPAEFEKSDLNFTVAATRDAIVMVEGGAQFVPEKEVLDALYYGFQEIQTILDMQDELRSKLGKEKVQPAPEVTDEALVERVRSLAYDRLAAALKNHVKSERTAALALAEAETQEALAADFPERAGEISDILHTFSKKIARSEIIKTKTRIDGRDLVTVRPIECEVGIIPRAHGSALFTRGETQAIVTATLGTSMDAQRVDSLIPQKDRTFMLHYNFPPYSTGEVKMVRGTGRREIGHGNLAERALRAVLPTEKDFPYVVRIVSDITESNGSSSMASVCGGTMALMDAGIKIQNPVAGVAMGLIKEGDDVAVLTDILGDEDHYGDMDFKVCGTEEGVTALQMDIKCKGLSRKTMEQALEQARVARLHILGEMRKAISAPRDEVSQYAPTFVTLKINPDKIRDVIGPGGKVIRSITERTGVKIDIEDDGTVRISSTNPEASREATEIIKGLTEEAEIGRVYSGVVKRIADFGAFVEILPGIEGLVHISQLANERVREVTDVVQEGDEVKVRVLDIDRQGRIRLSRKEALEESPQQ